MERQMYPEKVLPRGEERNRGLTEQEARRRLARDGYNQMQEKKPKSPLVTFVEQLKDPLIYILVVAAVISTMLGEISDAVIIVLVVLVNAKKKKAEKSAAEE